MKDKVFLGGSVSSTWRQRLIPFLKIDYFNPLVDEWNESAIRREDDEKARNCNIHLYVVAPETKGFYWAAEVMESLLAYSKAPDTKNRKRKTVLAFLKGIDGNDFSGDGFKRSINAVKSKVEKYGGIVVFDILELVKILNENVMEEEND